MDKCIVIKITNSIGIIYHISLVKDNTIGVEAIDTDLIQVNMHPHICAEVFDFENTRHNSKNDGQIIKKLFKNQF